MYIYYIYTGLSHSGAIRPANLPTCQPFSSCPSSLAGPPRSAPCLAVHAVGSPVTVAASPSWRPCWCC